MQKKILLVDDEKTVRDISTRYLEKEGYLVYQAIDGQEGFDLVKTNAIDLIITDIMMPKVDGYEFILNVLEENENMPFIFITAKNTSQDRLYSLTLGAEDYLTKPFNPLELVLRVKNILRRVYRETDQQVTLGLLEIDYEKRFAKINGETLELTGKEFLLLWLFAKDSQKVFSKSEILSSVWGSYSSDDQNTVNVHIHRLREKLNQYAHLTDSPVIRTVWGIGYKLEVTK